MAMSDLERAVADLDRAKMRLSEILSDARSSFSNDLLNEYTAVSELVLSYERRVAEINSESFASPIDLEAPWSLNSQFAVLFSSVDCATVAYDEVKNRSGIGIITFSGLYQIRCGGPNDEARNGHDLSGRGLGTYGVFEVHGSRWKASEIEVNSSHPQFSDKHWSDLKHFIAAFHDGQVEAIAKGFGNDVLDKSLQAWLSSPMSG
jgi:hypothetical protein